LYVGRHAMALSADVIQPPVKADSTTD